MTRRIVARRAVGHPAAGFSLIEMVVAATLLAVLSVLLLGGLRLGVRAADAGNRQQDRTDEVASAYGFIRRQLARAQPMYEVAHGERSAVMFRGDRHGVSFVDIAPDYVVDASYQGLAIRLQRDAGSGRLVARRHALRRWRDDTDAPHDSLLVSGLASAEFAYFGRRVAGAPLGWTPQWTSARSLPLLVRLRLTFADGQSAPELTVALRLAEMPDVGECGSGANGSPACVVPR